MKVFTRLILVLIFLAAVLGGIFGWKYYQFQQMSAQLSQPQPPATVSATRAREASWQPSIRAVGSLTAVNGIDITTEVAGKVRALAFESGARVSAGDTLVRLDDSVDRAALDGLVADRELARVQFERSSNLLPKRAVSQSQFDEAKAKYQAAQAQVAEQQARLAKMTITAPFDGLLGISQVDVGEYLSPGQKIVTLTTLDPIYVDYAVPERRFSELSVGRAVEVRVDAYPGRTFSGEISAIDSGVDEGTRTVDVRATLRNENRALRPGMFAEVETLEPRKRNVVTVPRTAVSTNTYGDFVFAITENDAGDLVAQRRSVTTGVSRDGRIEITDGLAGGDRVVSAGLVKLRDGQKVTIDNGVSLDGEVAEQ